MGPQHPKSSKINGNTHTSTPTNCILLCLLPSPLLLVWARSRVMFPLLRCLVFIEMVYSIRFNLGINHYSISLPIGSMYGIYANIWGIFMVNVTIYIAAPWIRHGLYLGASPHLCWFHPPRRPSHQPTNFITAELWDVAGPRQWSGFRPPPKKISGTWGYPKKDAAGMNSRSFKLNIMEVSFLCWFHRERLSYIAHYKWMLATFLCDTTVTTVPLSLNNPCHLSRGNSLRPMWRIAKITNIHNSVTGSHNP